MFKILSLITLMALVGCGKDCSPKRKCLKSHTVVTVGPDFHATHWHSEIHWGPTYGYHYSRGRMRWGMSMSWHTTQVADSWEPTRHVNEVCDEWGPPTIPEGCPDSGKEKPDAEEPSK